MNKILLSLVLMFAFSLTLVVAQSGYGEPEPTPTPSSNGGSSSSGGSNIICEKWTVCENGKQTKTCNNGDVINTRTCESVVPFVGNQTIDAPTSVTGEVTEPTVTEGFGDAVEEEKSSNLWIWLTGIVIVIAGFLIWFLNKD